MATYEILSTLIPVLEAKLAPIQKKCEKYGTDFRYEITGEEQRLWKVGGITIPVLVSTVEVEGVAVLNGWRVVASLEHTETGNIIRGFTGVEVPERYYTGAPVCEHCGTNRRRKSTFIVRNMASGEFKQVGKTCLKDFTGGLDASGVAMLVSCMDMMEAFGKASQSEHSGEQVGIFGGDYALLWDKIGRIYDLHSVLALSVEAVRALGYHKTSEDPSTAETVEAWSDYLMDNHISEQERKETQKVLERLDIQPARPETLKLVEDALEWIKNDPASTNYMHNLQVVCSSSQIASRHFGIACSLIPSYQRYLERKAAQETASAQTAASQWMGTVGKRLTVKIAEKRVLTSWEGTYGVTFIWKVTDEAGNVYIWKTGKEIDDDADTLVGTVKDHREYKGIRQTELTRCRVA